MAASFVSHYDVEQRTAEWHALRRIIGGSSVGSEIGISQYKAPSERIEEHSADERRDAAFAHGEKYEPASAAIFVKWLQSKAADDEFPNKELLQRWREQTYDANPGYDVPVYPHPYFRHEDDQALFGVSLDMRGSVIDVEIKNPTSYRSLYFSYLQTIQPVYFAQVQWAMAMRVRKDMFFVATSFDPETGDHLATVVWYVTFAERFFTEFMYPRARQAALALRDKRSNDVEWVNKNNQYSRSYAYGALLFAHCRRVYVWKDGAKIARIINQQKKK